MSGVRGIARSKSPYLSQLVVSPSQLAITTEIVTISRSMLTNPAPNKVCLKSIRKGVENSSLANVWSSGIVALNAKIAPTWITTNMKPANRSQRILVATAIGVSSAPVPISNNTR